MTIVVAAVPVDSPHAGDMLAPIFLIEEIGFG